MTRYWFVSAQHQRSAKLALMTVILAFFVILLGGYTRLTDAGLSCPDWPNCFGYLTAPHTPAQLAEATQLYPQTAINVKKAWTEMTHRYFAGTEGILILILAGSILLNKKQHWKSTLIAISLIALLSVQIMLGMLTVTAQLKPVIVLSHLLTGVAILSVLWLTYLVLNLHDNFAIKRNYTHFIPWLWIGLLIIILQITLGGWVSTHYAGLACIDLPYCNGQLLPPLHFQLFDTDLITIHMLHRIGAVITASYLGVLALCLLMNTSFRSIAVLILGLVALQITLGILNIIWLRPIWIAVIHQAVAIFILLTMITVLVKAYSESQDNRYAPLFV